MKRRSTTPVSKKLVMRLCLMGGVFLMLISGAISFMPKAHADSYDDKMSAIQAQINHYEAQAKELNQQVQTLQAQLASLGQQKAAIQAQIDLSQAKYDLLQQQIKDNEAKIKDGQDALGDTIANMYVDNDISPIEMLASSKNISSYLDKQSYRASIQDQLTETIRTIKTLKQKLEKDKADVAAVLNTQTAQKNSLVAVVNQQQALLSETRGQEAAYQQLVANNRQKLESVASQQRAYYQSLLGSSGGASAGVYGSFQYANLSPDNGAGGCSGGYPYCQAQDSVVDPWQLYNRECVSYVAWALQNRFGKYVSGFHGEGNAYQWPSSAVAYSGAVRVYDPQPGDAVILPASGSFAPIGHAMIVESVGGDGWIHVSQFNFYGTGQYSTMDIKSSGVIFLRFHG